MAAKLALTLIALSPMFALAFSQAQSSKIIGSWRVEIMFGNGVTHTLRLEARDSGKGSFQLVDARSKVWGFSKPSEAKWTEGNQGSVTFSGPVEFPLGNIGRDAGTLVLKGEFGTEGAITGEAEFFPIGQEPKDAKPSKSGAFKAVRVTG